MQGTLASCDTPHAQHGLVRRGRGRALPRPGRGSAGEPGPQTLPCAPCLPPRPVPSVLTGARSASPWPDAGTACCFCPSYKGGPVFGKLSSVELKAAHTQPQRRSLPFLLESVWKDLGCLSGSIGPRGGLTPRTVSAFPPTAPARRARPTCGSRFGSLLLG